MVRTLILGLYVPIVALAGAATWLLWQRLVLPAWRAGQLGGERLALGLGAMFAMASHALENGMFGLARWNVDFYALLVDVRWVLAGKLLILAGAVYTLGALIRAETTRAHLGRLAALAVALWVLGVVLAHLYADRLAG